MAGLLPYRARLILRESCREADLSTQPTRACAPSRLALADGHQEWPQGDPAPPRPRPQAPDRLGPDPIPYPADQPIPDTPLPKLEKLRKRWQFLAVARGRAAARGAVLVQAAARVENPSPGVVGVGFTATRKLGGAVVRNRAKRRLRAAARQLAPLHGQGGHDYVLIARSGAATRPWTRLLDDVERALLSLAAGGDDPSPARRPRNPAPSRTS